MLNIFKQLFSSQPSAGDIDRRFELLGRTGQGSMSKVWRAKDRSTGKMVCLKILDKVKTRKFEDRFVGLKKPSEGEILMMLKHRNVVHTFEYGLTNAKEPFIIMELIEGVGFNYLIETKNKQLEGNRINYLTQLAVGLEHIHSSGFLHRDICPRNVMVNKEGVVKIIDLGLTIPHKPEFCKPGNRTGTASYLAPELILRMTTDQRVDLFALGVTAYETFTGDTPWDKKGSSGDVLKDIVNSAPRDPLEFRPDLDKETIAFLMKAIGRNARDRFQTASQFREALSQLPPHW